MQKHEINLAKSELDIRKWRDNVEKFISSERFMCLDPKHQQAMRDEFSALCFLQEALARRMGLLGIRV